MRTGKTVAHRTRPTSLVTRMLSKKKHSIVNHCFDKMVSFHNLQELFLSSHAQGILDDEELLLLNEE